MRKDADRKLVRMAERDATMALLCGCSVCGRRIVEYQKGGMVKVGWVSVDLLTGIADARCEEHRPKTREKRMMAKTDQKQDDSGPAFPFPVCSADGNLGNGAHGGMSLRDYFAAAALRGIMATNEWNECWNGYSIKGGPEDPTIEADRQVAKMAYRVADAMFAERQK